MYHINAIEKYKGVIVSRSWGRNLGDQMMEILYYEIIGLDVYEGDSSRNYQEI